jgi:hypothetical protein
VKTTTETNEDYSDGESQNDLTIEEQFNQKARETSPSKSVLESALARISVMPNSNAVKGVNL